MKRTRDIAGFAALASIAMLMLAACQRGGSNATTSAGPAAAPHSIAIAVTENGFEPAEVTVHKGERVTLVVTRKTENTCATEFVMKSQGIHKALPLDRPVTIAFTPTEAGEVRYACGMDMITGKVIVK